MADNGSSMYTGGEELRAKGHEPSGKFRGSKTSIYEGGHRVPFFARWPGKIAPGTSSDETICLTDMLATAAVLLEAELPQDAGEDSYDILPVLLGQKRSAPIREATVHQSAAGQLAIRQGPWKLILPAATAGTPGKRRGEPAKPELYNLVEDLSETKNVFAEHPEVVSRLTDPLTRYQRSGHSRPY